MADGTLIYEDSLFANHSDDTKPGISQADIVDIQMNLFVPANPISASYQPVTPWEHTVKDQEHGYPISQ
ncbi:hypothetical protein T265_00167 [Opisthorchis viverrini]|uniref:Uncharacterized protein n=1 Tax=Opisthorchis viverrini TaxID=6198 RepID=A0A075A7G4_OPIVI|nr:hypothetical protein T265_00167 [Opisthorchis viverrini]KER34327.1 hypothetical protein T265_00167 [Opisthorchis viverrini]